ncbi:hypothetical protein LOK74_00820 [Brevibacillus humidisoli]|uniref:ATP-binding protein n=1 Tax=Brevibacillus humidisoli TaxID=2895522 RepID=UPI001E54559C|nr:ATP-binding protein [Brevibacillus humidisoli]UFJ41137.1 hypothetical protein LOK74_00820 [Brevibacillus humidisoli]
MKRYLRKATVTVKHFVKDEQVFVIIQDTGVGIPRDRLERLGTPFFSTKPSGTGICGRSRDPGVLFGKPSRF